MRLSILVPLVLVLILPLVYGQQPDSNSDSLQGDNNGNKDGDLDIKNDEAANDNENKEAKPRKTTFKEERFEKLFNNRHRSKPRLLTPKYHQKPKGKLPAYIKNPPIIKPLGQDGLPVDDAIPPRVTTPSSRARQSNNRSNVIKTTTTTQSSRTRSRLSTTTTTLKPPLNDKRFNSARGNRIASIPSGRTRIN